MSTARKMTRKEIEFGRDEYQRRQREKLGGWYDAIINRDAVLPDPWTVLLQREEDGQTIQ
ncbi:MAG: hypothetical protein IIB77_03280 [Proteobacteria bacterium]|nr:hypothetical protein [Pseudomonadota bacterium]